MSKAKTRSLPIINHRPQTYSGPSRDEVIALRHQYVSPGVINYYKDPLMIVEGHMQYVYDETGKRYLDGFAGIVTISVGHCHPRIIAKVKAQAETLQHTTTIYLHPTIAQFAEKLASKMPPGVDSTYFTNSGSEANELAVLCSREHTGNTDVIALRNGYHGGTTAAMGLTAHGNWRFKSNQANGIHHTHPGYCYRCPYGLSYPSCDLKCAHDIKNVIQHETSGEIACFIGEPVQGVGGTVVPPKEFFQIVYQHVRDHGGLCVADEVQGGFGRTGSDYWAHQYFGVVPDMVVMAKGIGNGAPLGAMTTHREIGASLNHRVHFNTYGGNPMSMTQGLATMEVIETEGIQENALRVGTHLKQKLIELQERHAIIGDVRGLGLLLGVELVADRQTKQPASVEAGLVMELAKERGLLIGKGGLFGNTLRIKPPMCITLDDADFLIDVLDEVFSIVV
jgi:alanine-glyoxylate transaminase/(R)-3-amino-2-methylpropionate-pyruvate transaminase